MGGGRSLGDRETPRKVLELAEVLQKRVASALATNRRRIAMAGVDFGRVRKREQELQRSIHRSGVAGWKIGSTDGIGEERVSHKRQVCLRAPDANHARTMAGEVHDLKGKPTKAREHQDLPGCEKSFRLRRKHRRRNEATEIEIGVGIEVLLQCVAEHRNRTELEAHLCEPSDVVAVAVRKDAEFWLQSLPKDELDHRFGLVRTIDDPARLGIVTWVKHDIPVGRKVSEFESLELQGWFDGHHMNGTPVATTLGI